MRLLLDTQVALWWLTASARLPKPARTLMAAWPCVVSVASVWEVALKHGLGRLEVAPRSFRDEIRGAGAAILSISDEHVLAALDTAPAHRDPFDRLLLGVALSEHLVLLTADAALVELTRNDPRLPVRNAQDRG